MYLYGRRKKILIITIILFLVAFIFLFLWFTQLVAESDDGEPLFQIIDGPKVTPEGEKIPEETPTPTLVTMDQTPIQTPTPVDPKVGIAKLCKKSIDSGLCLSKVALVLGDAALCEETNLKESCYLNVAMDLRDLSLCDKTDAEIMCRAIALDEPELCETVRPGEGVEIDVPRAIEVCYLDTAIHLKKIELCEKTNIPWDCIYQVAIITENLEWCEKGNYKVECEALVKKDPSLCEQAFAPNMCYGLLAIKLNDVSLIEKSAMGADYYYEIARNTENLELCSKSLDPVKCEAVISRDEEKCNDASNRKACFGDLAVALAEDEATKTE